MKSQTKRAALQIALTLPMLFLSLALVAHAQSTPCGGGVPNGNSLVSPLPCSMSTPQSFLSAALTALVKVSLPVITVFIVYSGFLFVTAQGNQSKLENAKRNFFFVVLGALLILSAWILANIIGGTVTQILGT